MQTVCLRHRRGVIGDRVWKIRSKTGTCYVVQPLSHRFAMPAPLVGEPLARRQSLRNAKASPTRRGVTAGDGEVVQRQTFRQTVKRNGNVSCSTTSQSSLRDASSPCRKDSLRPEGDVANSDRGRTTSGETGDVAWTAKASPTRRGVTAGDGEVVRRET